MKYKRLVALFVVLTMSMTGFNTMAYDTWAENGVICMTPVTESDGSELTSVNAGETIKLKAKVKAGKNAEDGQTAQLIAVSYKGGLVNGMMPGEKVTVSEEVQLLTVAFSVPSDADVLKVFVLDGRDTRRPIAEAGVVGSGSVTVTGISVDGEMLADFSPEVYTYDVQLNAAYINYPEITIHTNDILAKTEIIDADPFPAENASVTARVTKNGEIATQYTINFTQKSPVVTDIKILNAAGEEVSFGTTIGRENPVELLEPEEFTNNLPKDTLYKNVINDTGLDKETDLPGDNIDPRNDRDDMALHYISPELLGGTLIRTPYKSAKYSADDKLSFKINRSATVYVYAQNKAGQNALGELGFVPAKGSPSYYLNFLPKAGDSSRTDDLASVLTFSYAINGSGVASRSRIKAWVKKDIIVDPSVGTATVEIPGQKQEYLATVVKFHEAPLVLNPKVTTEEGIEETTVLRNVFKPVMISDFDNNFTTEEYFENALYFSQIFSDTNAAGLTEFEDDIIGAEAIMLPYSNTAQSIEFELNHSAKVYLVSVDGGLTAESNSQSTSAWIKNSTPVAKEMVTQYACNQELVNITATNTTVEREYKVIPGETTKVQIDNLSEGRVFVFVKRTELE